MDTVSEKILTKRGRLFFAVIAIIGSIIGGITLVAIVMEENPQAAYEQQLQYSDLVAHQLLSEWECLPKTEQAHESFVLKVMQRFLPDDWKQVESGRKWMREYESKQSAGTLTVEERHKLHEAYNKKILPWRTDISQLDQRIINSSISKPRVSLSECVVLPANSCRKEPSLGFFLEPSCVPCQQPIVTFSAPSHSGDMQIYYEDDVVKWNPSDPLDLIKPRRNPIGLFMGEYHNLRNNWKVSQKISELEEQKARDDRLLVEARTTVLNKAAASVPIDSEEAAIKREYLRLKCH